MPSTGCSQLCGPLIASEWKGRFCLILMGRSRPEGGGSCRSRRLSLPGLPGARLGRLLRFQFSDFLLHRDPLPDHPVEVEAISGACMMVRREAITDIRPLHCEDLDWCMRAWRRGWKIVFVPQAKVAHHKGVSSRTRRLTVNITSTLGWSGSIASCLARRGRAGSSHYWRPVFG